MELSNDTEFGLTAAVYSKDIAKARRVAAKIRAGQVILFLFFCFLSFILKSPKRAAMLPRSGQARFFFYFFSCFLCFILKARRVAAKIRAGQVLSSVFWFFLCCLFYFFSVFFCFLCFILKSRGTVTCVL